MAQLLRHIGLPSRFVSGYLIQLRPDIKSLDGPSGTDHDFTDLHAWTEVYLPGAGWIGFDPTSGLLCGEGHIPVAATPHYRSAAPITGMVEPSGVDFYFEMKVERIAERPRVTAPFSDEAWAALDALGERVDGDLQARDVRLTMGGEPTFVSIDDYQSAEWNTAALGKDKLKRAGDLIQRLHDRFAPGALLHYGQGKWYPGEELPRWAYSLYWRRDGQPIWQNLALIAREPSMPPPTSIDAQVFTEAVAARLGLKNEYVQPLYEDPADRLLKEGALPPNIDPSNPKIEDMAERGRMLRAFERSLTYPTGFVLPVQHWNAQGQPGWLSELWTTRRGRLFLIPGDSPAGLRLPLASLPYFDSADYPHLVPGDPFDAHPPLAPAASFVPRKAETLVAQHGPRPIAKVQAAGIPVRTAMTIEVRDGRLCVFMPPTEKLEEYLILLAAVEATAADKKLPVHIEGYPPPHDPRVNVIKVTPDPGVIEVNVQPAASWREAVDITRGLYDDAHHSRLGTDKFMIDGRHTGTGGGNHVVLGGQNAGRQSVPAAARSAQELRVVLAAASVVVVPVLRPVHRADQSGAAHRRSAPGFAVRTRNRLRQGAGAGHGRSAAALAHRPPVPQHSGRRHRQYAPHRNLHRQIVFARQRDRPAWSGRIPLVRNAARRAHVAGAAVVAARAHRLVLARAARG